MERYFDLYSTTVGVGGYTAGSGVLNVGATSPISLGSGDTCALLVVRNIAGVITPIVLLTASVVNSSTQFAVAAEGSDTNALAGDTVINVLSARGMNQIRNDLSAVGTRANLPSTTNQKAGNRYKCTDSPYEYIFDGSVWQPFAFGFNVVEPVLANFTQVNCSAVTFDTTYGGIQASIASAGSNQNVPFIAVAVPGSGAYYIDAAFTAFQVGNNGGTGIGLSAGTVAGTSAFAVISAGWEGNPLNIQEKEYNNTGSFNGNNGQIQPVLYGPMIWLRCYDDRTSNRTWYASNDGKHWYQVYQQGRTTNFTPAYAIFALINFSNPIDVHLLHFSVHT